MPSALRITVRGKVQGVGFRPFVYRLAHRHGIRGWVRNVNGAVEIHAEGGDGPLREFSCALLDEAPPLSAPGPCVASPCDAEHAQTFSILASDDTSSADIHLPADGFVCAACLAELHDPGNRRYRYPFINCTQCGPRYTLITALPYDRPNTAMRDFPLCHACRQEYVDPLDRRFHAEPVACTTCGPHLQFVAGDETINGDEAALAAAIVALRAGKIVAVKGVGGYHLMCDARNDTAVATLRARKRRPGKPLAVMFRDIDALRGAVVVNAATEARLASPERPIVLLEKKPGNDLAEGIAPGLAEVGCLLPYSPVHELLLNDVGGPLVATSGNLSGEPVLTENAEAATRLHAIADAWLHHDRPIVRPADDPVYRVIAGAPRPLRLGRGSAPLELVLPCPLPEPVLALGSHMKNTICLAWDRRAIMSPHIGELDTVRTLDTLTQVAADLQRLYQVHATRVIVDRHPGYGTRRHVRESGLPGHAVWHHHAHASALAWEFPEVEAWIVFAWDGVGLGEDGSLWGGEALVGAPGQWRRRASFRPFRLPGGDKAGRQPWRSAAALLWETSGAAPFAPDALHEAWTRGINSPLSSGMGRLFDAAAALCGVCTDASFEGEAPMRLEAAADMEHASPVPLPCEPDAEGVWRTDWAPLVPLLMDGGQPVAHRAASFHASLAAALLGQAQTLAQETGIRSVGLTGGVFQNRKLAETALARLQAAGFTVCLPRRIPVNDAGLSFGQVMEFLYR